MQNATQYSETLDRSSRKFRCRCGHKTLVRYRNQITGEYLEPAEIGRCDRENRCGYHLTPKQYREANGIKTEQKEFCESIKKGIQEPPPVDFLPMEYLAQLMPAKFYSRNNFFNFLRDLFGELVARQLFAEYCLGTSAYWKGACVFPQIDTEGNLRQIKIMLHDAGTGKRMKEGATVERMDRATRQYVTEVTERSCSLVYGRYIAPSTRGLNLEQTFFGAHLLTEYPDKPVCVVESEKTALIASVYFPGFVWLATGGASGCKWREYATYKALKGRSVTFFPDHGYFNRKSERTCYEEWVERCARISDVLPGTTIRVSNLLEKRLAGQERQDKDLADLLLTRDEQFGCALSDAGYPITWDLPAKAEQNA